MKEDLFFFARLHINKLTCIKGAWTHWKMADWKQNSPNSVNVHNYKSTTQNVLKAVWRILIQHLRDKKYCIWFCGYCLKLTVMMYCLMVSNGESAGNVFVTELPSGRRNWRRAEVLQKSKVHVYRCINYLNHCVMLNHHTLA